MARNGRSIFSVPLRGARLADASSVHASTLWRWRTSSSAAGCPRGRRQQHKRTILIRLGRCTWAPVRCLLALVAVILIRTAFAFAAEQVDLLLVLSSDVSRSVDHPKFAARRLCGCDFRSTRDGCDQIRPQQRIAKWARRIVSTLMKVSTPMFFPTIRDRACKPRNLFSLGFV